MKLNTMNSRRTNQNCTHLEQRELEKLQNGVACILKQCVNQLEDCLKFSNRVSNKDVADCIQHKLEPVDTRVLQMFLNRKPQSLVTCSNQLLDCIQNNRDLMIGTSQPSQGAKLFLEQFQSFVSQIEAELYSSLSTTEINVVEVETESGSSEVARSENADEEERWKDIPLTERCGEFKAEKLLKDFETHYENLIEREMKKSKPRMEWDWKMFEHIEGTLQEQLKKCRETFESAASECLAKEKEAKKKKIQLENDLLAIIDKYDKEMIEKREIYDKLLTEQNQEARKFNELKRQFKQQQEEYEQALREEEFWEHEDIDAQLGKLKTFIANKFLNTFLNAYAKVFKQVGIRRV